MTATNPSELLSKVTSVPRPSVPPLAQETTTEAEPQTRLIHFTADGFTAFGMVWYRGQELEITPDLYEKTLDKDGNSWLDSLDKLTQMRRFGEVKFEDGPWPYDEYEEEQALKAEKERARRPIVPRV